MPRRNRRSDKGGLLDLGGIVRKLREDQATGNQVAPESDAARRASGAPGAARTVSRGDLDSLRRSVAARTRIFAVRPGG